MKAKDLIKMLLPYAEYDVYYHGPEEYGGAQEVEAIDFEKHSDRVVVY